MSSLGATLMASRVPHGLEHWRKLPVRAIFRLGTGPTILREDLDESGEIPVHSASTDGLYFGRVARAPVLLLAGDLVITARGTIGVTKLVDEPSTCTQTTIYAKRRNGQNISTKFIWYYLTALRTELFPVTQTAIPMLTGSQVGEAPLLLPPLEEQGAIVDFLDRETAKIDALIEKQNELIVLLRARRKAMVRTLLTPVEGGRTQGRGWTSQPLKRALVSLDGMRIPLSSEERGLRQGEFPYYGASGVIDHVGDYLFDEELVLVSEDGANLLLRSTPIAFTASGRYWVNNHAHVLRPRFGPPHFWAARIEMEDISTFVTGSAQPKLTADALMNLRISWPMDLGEMIEVTGQLAIETARVDTLIAKTEEFIALAKERRAAIITAAVTGQIDVLGEAS